MADSSMGGDGDMIILIEIPYSVADGIRPYQQAEFYERASFLTYDFMRLGVWMGRAFLLGPYFAYEEIARRNYAERMQATLPPAGHHHSLDSSGSVPDQEARILQPEKPPVEDVVYLSLGEEGNHEEAPARLTTKTSFAELGSAWTGNQEEAPDRNPTSPDNSVGFESTWTGMTSDLTAGEEPEEEEMMEDQTDNDADISTSFSVQNNPRQLPQGSTGGGTANHVAQAAHWKLSGIPSRKLMRHPETDLMLIAIGLALHNARSPCSFDMIFTFVRGIFKPSATRTKQHIKNALNRNDGIDAFLKLQHPFSGKVNAFTWANRTVFQGVLDDWMENNSLRSVLINPDDEQLLLGGKAARQ